MKKYRSIILLTTIIFSVFLLQACSTPSQLMAQRYEQGKLSFEQENYAKAFRELEPIARAGNPDAQYAVGYMYYYGKGVVENTQKARYWMEQAAHRGQPHARAALAQINP